jgi:formiminotetrahydrofolate cyclodeaminase
LSSMVAHLTVGKTGYEQAWDGLRQATLQAQAAKDFFIRAIDDDTTAFNQVMGALRLPKKTPDEKAARKQALQAATRGATEVPLSVLRRIPETIELAEQAAAQGNRNSASDAGVAGLCARTAAEGAYYNVLINLGGIRDAAYVKRIRQEAGTLIGEVRKRTDALAANLERDLLGQLKD